MKGDKIKILAERNFMQYQGVRLHLAVRHEDGKLSVAQPPSFEILPEGYWAPEFMTLNDTEAQVLLDSLYECGYRPSRPAETAGQLDAVKYHLEDMRRLVFKVDGKEGG
jgi:hypothetical protein